MSITTNLIRFSLAGSILAASLGTVMAGDEPRTRVFKPGRGISIDVGAVKVAGYYTVANGTCAVTLMLGARADADGNVAPGVTRVDVPVAGGAKSRVFTSEGRAVQLTCATGAKLLAVSTQSYTLAELR
jgi:hypothetical protein